MKNSILFLFIVFCITSGLSQNTEDGLQSASHVLTPELINLYEQSKTLDANNASPQEIEANRLAIKDAWMQINPEIGNLYKPIETHGKLPEIIENVHINGLHSTGDEEERVYDGNAQNRWGTDIQIYSGFVDGGVDVITDNLGDIYSLHYESFGTTHIIYIHKSTDNGDTWSLFADQTITAPILQAQLVSIHGTGDNYLLAYFVTDSKTFQALRWNTTAGGAMQAQVMATDVVEFAVDRNYPVNTNAQRVFAIFKDEALEVSRAARSTAGSFGFDWVDEATATFGVNSLDLAYGRDGSCYVVGVGNSSENLRVKVNTNFMDPASWGASSTLESGVDRETLNPTIIAGRESLANDNVFVFASSRAAGSTNQFDGRYYRRVNDGAFSTGSDFSSGGTNFNILHPDSYIRFSNGAVTARLSYVREVIDNSESNQNRSITYNGTGLDPLEPVADATVNVYNGFKSATAELLSTNEPVLVFAGTDGNFGSDLFFDKQSSVLSTTEFDLSNILVYPNPVSDNLIISSPQKIVDEIIVYNYLGQLVLNSEPGALEARIDMSVLNKGLYLVQISVEGSLETHKVIKM
ncbi:MAG: T9SS type A sorting domain-containing protein [Flavobacteriaceae bacterium]